MAGLGTLFTPAASSHELGGFVGSVVYQGEISPWLPLIKAGEILHIGKATAFGLGKYVIN